MHWFQLDFCGKRSKESPSCCHQTRRRLPLLHTSILRALHGPELSAVLWLETPWLTQNTKCAFPPRGELKTFFCCCYLSISVIGRRGWGQKLDWFSFAGGTICCKNFYFPQFHNMSGILKVFCNCWCNINMWNKIMIVLIITKTI